MGILLDKEETENGWRFSVEILEDDDSTEHVVNVSNEVYQDITKGKVEVDVLVEESFKFLLEREGKESILPSFNLEKISEYFPEYKKEMRKRLGIK